MADDQLPQPNPPTEVDVSAFRNGQEAHETDMFVAVMGVTGAGKSTLISLLATEGAGPQIGTNLSSCTQTCAVYQVAHVTNRNVYLVDTPGFDDTNMSDAEVLSSLANWLAITYSNRTKLHGILYLHRITDVRMQGSARRNLKVFKDLCGQDALKKVVLVTTMWEKLTSRDEGEARELELKTTEGYWGYMTKRGSKIERHTNDMQSARRLVDTFVPPDEDMIPQVASLAIQEEMTVQNKSLADTTAGEIVRDVITKEELRIAKVIEECRQEIREATQLKDTERHQDSQEFMTEMESNRKLLLRSHEMLWADLEQMVRTTYDQSVAERQDEKLRRLSEQYSVRSGVSLGVDRRQSPMSGNPAMSNRTFGLVPLQKHTSFKVNQPLSLSLRGRHCSFIGPAYTKSYLPESTRNSLVQLERSSNTRIRIKRIVLGEHLSYYTHYHEGSIFSRCYYHGAIRLNYPKLWSFLSQDRNTRCPDCISLGTEGSYFINIAGKKSLQSHPNSEINLSESEIKRLWWGYQGSYIVELEDGQIMGDLRGYYSDLATLLQERRIGIKDLALNIGDGTSFVLVLDDGTGYCGGTDDIIGNCFEEYASRHSTRRR